MKYFIVYLFSCLLCFIVFELITVYLIILFIDSLQEISYKQQSRLSSFLL